MERRIFIAILLAALVMYGWQVLFPPPVLPDRAATQQTQPAPAASPAPAAPPAAAAPAPAAASAVPEAITSEAAEREIVVETATVQAVLTNRGGRLLHWRLKDYRDGGDPVDLVPSNLPADQPKPFSLQVDDPQVTQRLNDAIYRVTGDVNGRVDAAQNGTVTFEFQDASGLHARKEFRFDPRNFVVVFSADVMNGAQALNPGIAWGPGLSDAGATSGGGSFFTGNYVQPPQAIYHLAGDVERLSLSDVTELPVHEGQFRFAG